MYKKAANLLKKASANFCVNKKGEEMVEVFDPLLHVVHFVRVVDGRLEVRAEPAQAELVHRAQLD